MSSFTLGLNQKDHFLLLKIQNFFGGIGTIRKDIRSNALKYTVSDLFEITNNNRIKIKKNQYEISSKNKIINIFKSYFIK